MQESQLRFDGRRIFLSYAKEDRHRVRSIHRELVKNGLSPWIDISDLEPGQDWQHVILSAIRKARFVLLFLSRVSVIKAGYFQKEISEALRIAETFPEGHKYIIPVRLQDCVVPERLANWHWVDVHKPYGLRRLIETLRVGPGIGLPSRPKVLEPQTNLSDDAVTDAILSAKFRQREFISARIYGRGTAISNGHILEFRRLTKTFKQGCGSTGIRRFSSEQMLRVLPKENSYKKDENIVTSISWTTAERYFWLESKSGCRCAVDRDYVTYILRKYPRGVVYVTDKESVVVVESNQRIQFLVMPLSV
jgi:hypothetical protein